MFNFFKKKTYNDIEVENYEKNTTGTQYADISNGNFSLTVEDIFSITGRGTVVTGQVSGGEIHVGETVNILDLNGNIKATTKIVGVEMFRKLLDYAKTGDNVGLLLSGISRNGVSKGDRIVK